MLKINQATIALLASSYNLSILNQIWLVDNNVVTKAEMESSESFLSPVAVNIATANYELLVLQDRVQLTLLNGDYEKGALVKRIFENLIKALPHTPYKAIGFNFKNIITPSDSQNSLQRVKELYLTSSNPLSSFFQSDDSRFGLYLSTDSLQGTRLRLDIKPNNSDNLEHQVLNFNYNLELSGVVNRVETLLPILDKWDEFQNHAETISHSLDQYLDGGTQ
jgi:hypothetical protein